tara:strand:+ start:10895 stop:11158 length:264 start_codon:yes stop_codon:yes gene_type:complete
MSLNIKQKIQLNSKWLSSDNLSIIQVISINKTGILYKDVINNTHMIRSNSFNDFIQNYKKVDLDTSLYGGLPKNYKRSKEKNLYKLV